MFSPRLVVETLLSCRGMFLLFGDGFAGTLLPPKVDGGPLNGYLLEASSPKPKDCSEEPLGVPFGKDFPLPPPLLPLLLSGYEDLPYPLLLLLVSGNADPRLPPRGDGGLRAMSQHPRCYARQRSPRNVVCDSIVGKLGKPRLSVWWIMQT